MINVIYNRPEEVFTYKYFYILNSIENIKYKKFVVVKPVSITTNIWATNFSLNSYISF